ncbi:response regulator transcription factor [Corynebacterium cystitidis]|uniref:Two component transcriptional regulator, LuxR family n=1 Tax=Corynebacterium cystitidis DSM 20524 TaxID=1121357 RepID=A0A1H9VJC3_9CORY|nr:response regulator transcription factor [Corynebacterium cystitidis]WJY81434.1 Transcriptional regulatory protein DegU [Corynebacterium cystitidis DSM 20524]SES21805.1 two component transcriptional regulator, LuxR family [Corynebacterium cystitidis DSM 20524]SNV87456.1 two-component system response regulator [Corynebacterium cystitidis]
MINIVLADDQPLLLAALSTVLDAQDGMRVVATAADGVEAVDRVRGLLAGGQADSVDVAVLDIRMPRMDGITAAREILALPGAPRVIMLTTFDDPELVTAAIEAGVHGFLLKDAEPEDLAAAVRRVHAGQSILASGVTGAVLESYRALASGAQSTQLEPHELQGLSMLTPRELEVLTLIAGGATNKEIAEQLFIAETTVKTHVGNLMSKLHARDRVALVLLAQHGGLLPQ